MSVAAEDIVEFIASNISVATFIAKMTGSTILITFVAAVDRVVDSEEERQQLAAWLRYLPYITGDTAAPPEPELPANLEDMRTSLEELRVQLSAGE